MAKKKEKKENYVAEAVATPLAGAAAIVPGMIDLRKKPQKFLDAKHLGDTYSDVKKYIKPGDYLIGAPKMPSEVASGEVRDFIRAYKDARTRGGKRLSALSDAVKQVDLASVLSKASDPYYSHMETIVSPKESIYIGGGGKQHISTQFNKSKNHYLLVRPKGKAQNRVLTAYRKGGVRAVNKIIKPYTGDANAYTQVRSAYSQIKDWLTPKFKNVERNKTVRELARDAGCTTGYCSTAPAALSNRTVGGKKTMDVLPVDFLRSDDFKVIGRVGSHKATFTDKLISKTPKYLAKGIVGAAAAGATFGGVKAIKAMSRHKKNKEKNITKKARLSEAYNNAFKDEVEKIAASLHPGDAKRFAGFYNNLIRAVPEAGKTTAKGRIDPYKILKMMDEVAKTKKSIK